MGLHSKEREIKIKSRLFAMMTLEMRYRKEPFQWDVEIPPHSNYNLVGGRTILVYLENHNAKNQQVLYPYIILNFIKGGDTNLQNAYLKLLINFTELKFPFLFIILLL